MEPLKAVVRSGRLVLDEPTDLPEGSVVELYPALEYDPPPDELAKLGEVVARAAAEESEGKIRPARDLLDRLRASR